MFHLKPHGCSRDQSVFTNWRTAWLRLALEVTCWVCSHYGHNKHRGSCTVSMAKAGATWKIQKLPLSPPPSSFSASSSSWCIWQVHWTMLEPIIIFFENWIYWKVFGPGGRRHRLLPGFIIWPSLLTSPFKRTHCSPPPFTCEINDVLYRDIFLKI